EVLYPLCRPSAKLYVFTPSIKLKTLFNIITPPWDYVGQLVWDKKRIGLGHYYRNQIENIMFFCKPPRTRLRRRDLSNLVSAKNPGKSRKPPSIYEMLAKA